MRRDDPVSLVMTTEPVTVQPSDTIDDIRGLLVDDIHHLPVVNDEKLVGIVSSADLMRLSLSLFDEGADENLGSIVRNRFRAGDIMQEDPITIAKDSTVFEAATKLSAGGFHSLPVVDRFGNLAGIVTSTDLIHYLLRHFSVRLPDGPRHAHDVQSATDEDTSVRCSRAELKAALDAARSIYAADEDDRFMARSLLVLNAQSSRLTRVLEAAEHYLHSGMGAREHSQLVRAIRQARQSENASQGREPALFGLE